MITVRMVGKRKRAAPPPASDRRLRPKAHRDPGLTLPTGLLANVCRFMRGKGAMKTLLEIQTCGTEGWKAATPAIWWKVRVRELEDWEKLIPHLDRAGEVVSDDEASESVEKDDGSSHDGGLERLK